MGIDASIDQLFKPVADTLANIIFYSVPIGGDIEVKLILIWLIAVAVFFTFYLGFINIRYFKHAIDLVRGKHGDIPSDDGQLSRFQALMASLSGTVGLGNIGGVAAAVSLGGPGAVLWMIILGFFGMSSKFAEVMLAVKYRVHNDPDHPEKISGGPMYYLKAGFEKRNLPLLGTIFASMFAVFCILGSVGGGNMFQANQAFQQMKIATGGDASFMADSGWAFGVVLAILVGIVIVGGIKSIGSVASKLVPFMGAVYLGSGLIVIAMHAPQIPEALYKIFVEAFSPQAGYGGFIGVLLVGAQRAFFSNEAGLGSAAIVHSTAKTHSHVSQGMVGMLGPFIDTVVICTVTALVIVITGVYDVSNGIEGVELTSRAFESAIPGFKYVLSLTVLLFAFSTMITWSYYGVKGATYLFGQKAWVEITFKIFFCLCVIVGASSEFKNIILFTDAMLFSMAIPNVVALYLFAPEIKRDVKEYIQALKNK